MRKPPSGSFIIKKKRYTSALSTDWKASWVPTVHRASMAAYVGALSLHYIAYDERRGEKRIESDNITEHMFVHMCEYDKEIEWSVCVYDRERVVFEYACVSV